MSGGRSGTLGYCQGYGISLDIRVSHLIIESDSANALRLIKQMTSKSGMFTIINNIHQLCDKDWRFDFSTVVCRNNGVTDRLAKLASNANFDIVFFDDPMFEMELG
ncbi:hypothetical protein GQ457_06G034730 [Hibiscus cannabinus]